LSTYEAANEDEDRQNTVALLRRSLMREAVIVSTARTPLAKSFKTRERSKRSGCS